MKKRSFRKVEEFSQLHTDNKWRMDVGVGLTAKASVISTASCCFTRKSEFFPRSQHKGGSSSRESEDTQDEASGLVSLVALPAGQSLKIACFGSSVDRPIISFCFLTAFAHFQSLGISLICSCASRDMNSGSIPYFRVRGFDWAWQCPCDGSHDFVFVWGPVFTWL